MKQLHPHNQDSQESHLERAFVNLKRNLSLSWEIRENIRSRVFEKIDMVAFSETTALFDDLKQNLTPQSTFVAQTKLDLMARIEAYKPLSWRARMQYMFGNAVGYGVSFLFVLSITSIFLISNLQPSKAEFVGELQIRQGNAFIVRASSKFEVRSGEKVLPGDVIEVGDTSLVDINFYQQRQANLHSNTKVRIEKDTGDTKEIVLSLEKGKLAATPSSSTSEASLRVATLAGTVMAPESSAFILEVDAVSQKASLRVEQSEVELLASNVSNSNQNSDTLVASTISSGEEKFLLAFGDPQMNVPSEPLLAFSSQNEFAAVDTNQNANTAVVNTSTTRRNTTKKPQESIAETALNLPTGNEMSVHSRMRLSEIGSDLEIAKVKLKQLLSFADNDPDQAIVYAKGYIQTVQRVANKVTPKDTALRAPLNDNNIGDVLMSSPLSTALNSLPALSKDLDEGDKNTAYQQAKQTIDELYALESALIIHSKLSEKETIASLPPKETADTLSTLKTLETQNGYNTKQKIEGLVEADILGRIEGIVAVDDRDTRAKLFTSLLASIPNDVRNTKLLETVMTRVPADLKGYVSVKLHTIRNSVTK